MNESILQKKFALDSLFMEDDIDLKKAREILAEISKLELERRMLSIVHQMDIEKILTAEQKKC